MKKIFLFFIALIYSVSAYALEIPEKPTAYVNDYASLLNSNTKAQLEKTLYDFEQKTSNQIVVAIFGSLDGQSLEDFSIRLAEKWKIGGKEKDNGVILLIFRDDRQVRIEVGYGLEGVLPDALASQIIRKEFVPFFKAGRYDEGVLNTVSAIMQATKSEYKADFSKKDPLEAQAPFLFFILIAYLLAPIMAYFMVLVLCTAFLGFPAGIFAAFGIICLLAIIRKFLLASMFGQTLTSRSHRNGMWSSSGGGWGSGGGFGGGFGGGGGGGFGGGGASGRW